MAAAMERSTEVEAKARRRRFSAEYKRRILQEAVCRAPARGRRCRGHFADVPARADELSEWIEKHVPTAGALIGAPLFVNPSSRRALLASHTSTSHAVCPSQGLVEWS